MGCMQSLGSALLAILPLATYAPTLTPLASRRHYHANLTAQEREDVQSEWTNGDVPIIVATIAFGMGACGVVLMCGRGVHRGWAHM